MMQRRIGAMAVGADSREGFEIGQAWGQRKAGEVLKELKAERLIKD